ncbi:MAG: InlB B-repeat-containing protein [Ruthenibacterium lactatiformans]
MKNTSNALRRVMSVVLVFAMMFTSMPTGALAEDVVDPAPSTTAAEPAASETTEPTTPEPASSEAAPAANSAVLPANDGDPAPVTFTVTFVANGETLVTQTIQQGGSAVAPDAPLVSGQRFVRWDTDFTNVQSDLTVTAVYEAITAKNMTVEYRYSDGTQAAPSHVEQAVVGEPFHKTVPSPALDGFTPDKAEVVFAVESVTEDLTVVVTYSGAARNYTVKHLFQNVEGTAYAEDEALRETLEGTTGLDTAAQAKTVEGFTALPITQVKVASSGETVVEVKYDRNSYLLTWNTDGGSYIEPQMLKYGAAVSAPADPTKVGYTFAGWDLVPETMPAAATTVTAQWANATQASYQVVYWGENLTGGYDYLYADKATGAVGGNIPYSTSLTASHMPQGLEAAGFELDSAKSAGNVEITADGSAVKNVYFSRKTFTISFYRQSWVGWPDFEYKWVEDTSLRITAKYGEDVSARWEAACEDDGWGPNKNDNIQYTLIANMPAENLTMYEKSSGTGKKIEYRVQKVSGTGYDVYATFNASRGVSLTVEDQMPITGFTYDSWKKSGDSPLWLYYTRNSYNLVFENCTGVSNASLKFEARLSSAKPADSSVGRPAGMDSDYVFMGWYLDEAFQTPVDWSSTMPARNLQVYAKWAKPDYTVSFNTHGADTETPAPIGVAKYDTIEDQMPADPTREGYVFAGWYTDEAYTVPFVATQQIVRNLTLHAKWTRTDSCTYVIVAKDTEGNELKRVDGSEVEVGASVTVNAPVIDGYQAQQSSQNVKILDDGQEVVFVYDKLQNWTATVHHYIEGTTEKVAEDVIRSDLTVNSLLVYSATVSGYELAEGTSYVQTATRENSEITFYYKKIADSAYTVNHYYGSNASLTETVTGTAKAGSLVTADVINKVGYTCVTSGAALSAYVAKDGSTVINVYYAANDQTYSVYYYLEGTETPVPGTTAKENVSAKFDETVTETALAVTGYTVAGDSTRSITVGADNAANKIVFYYTVNSYPLNITYKYADDVPDAALRGQKAAEPVSRDIAFGAPYSVASPLIPGYTASVAAVAGTMAENGVTVEVVYRAATDTAYTVKHMLQDVTGDGYTEDAAARQTLHGTTGADTNAAAKSYEGFTAQAVVQQAIAADGSTVVEIKYDRNSYEVTYAYVGTAPAGASALPEKATVKYGAPVAVAAAATAPGYTFSGWSQKEDFTMPAENVTITGSFTANSNTEYTVRHHFQNILDDAYDADTAMLSETLSGTTDTLTAAAAKTVAGFTAQSFQQKNIAGDGSTVVDIYYNRNSYGVSYRYLNTPAGASALPAGASYRFGAAVTVAEAATAPGYTFSGWSTGDFTMPAQDVEITGSFTANGDTAYTVEHYQQNLAGDGYDLVEADTEHLTGETDTTATANPKTYTGFTFDGTVEGTVASGNIAGDGSLVLKLYYTRNSYGVTYAYTGTVPADASALPEKAAVKYGAPVTVAEAATAKGHTFSGWSTGDFTMPAQDVEITGSFTANPYNVTVEYYFDKAQDTDMTRVQSVTYGETFTTAAAAETDRNGVHYTLDWVENNGLTVSDIEADNVVRVYYAKDEEGGPDDIPDYAQIVFTYQSADVRKGTVDKSVEIHTFERLNGELLEEKKASPAGANAAGREGYAFDYWTDGTKRDVTSGMETLKSEVYTDNAEFTAYFDVDTKGIDPEDPDKPDNVPDKYQAKVTYQAVNGTVTLGDRTGTELVTYVTLFDADGKWAENGTGKLAEAQVPTAAAAADYDPATERWTPAVPAEGAEITADGAVFTVTWELAISGYQVHYYYDGVEDTASAVNATGKIGDAIPYDTGKTTFDGANYVLENVDGAGKLISKDAAANIVNVNFTKDEKSDPTKDPDPEVPGDNIPDKYQATVTFEAINGVLQPKGGTDAQNTKQMTTVVTLLNENGEPAENGTGYLTEAQIPTALANLGYIANTLFWGPATPTTSYAITGDITFVADFNAEGVIPEEPPVPPVTPVGPTAPEEGPEETIDEPETPLAPAEPEAPAEEPAEEEIEEADTPLASGAAWALLNLILMLCTALVSILLLIGFLGKKKKEDENENVEYTVKRKGVTRVLSLIPAIGSIIAFLLTENMRNPMVFVDRWTWLMVLIALVQVIVCIFARKEEEPDDNAQTRLRRKHGTRTSGKSITKAPEG